MRQRPPIGRPDDSRLFTDQALAELREGRYAPRAWGRFGARCGLRSWQQIRLHPRAAAEISALHLVLATIPGRPLGVLAGSWLLTVTHPGLLGPDRRSIGAANALSLVRASLPLVSAAPLLAMASDLADGWLARRRGPTAFGGYADGLADVTFWTRFATRRSGPLLGALALAGWTLPAVLITTAYFARGGVIDYPRPVWGRRLSAGLQCVIAAAALVGVPRREED